ncbi:MAG: hypothetical protein ABDI07_10395 [Candidatus Kryptonium sp.]
MNNVNKTRALKKLGLSHLNHVGYKGGGMFIFKYDPELIALIRAYNSRLPVDLHLFSEEELKQVEKQGACFFMGLPGFTIEEAKEIIKKALKNGETEPLDVIFLREAGFDDELLNEYKEGRLLID